MQETPVLVVVRHEKGVLSWQLPLLLQENKMFKVINKVPCQFFLWAVMKRESYSLHVMKHAVKRYRYVL
jgi:hypothetical protein